MAPLARALDALAWWPLRAAGDRGGRPRGVLWAWAAWDALLSRRWRLRAAREGGVVRFRIVRYHGPDVLLGDGTRVRRDDPVVEVHLDDRMLLRLSGNGRRPRAAVAVAADELRALAARAASGALGEVRAIRGVSLFGDLARTVDAEVRPLPRTARSRLLHYYLVGLIALRHPAGWRAASRYRGRWPRELWIRPASRPSEKGQHETSRVLE